MKKKLNNNSIRLSKILKNLYKKKLRCIANKLKSWKNRCKPYKNSMKPIFRR